MNNIYVDELPKSCKECGHTIYWDIDDVFVCSLNNRDREHLEGDDYKKGLKLNSCPLKLLSTRLAEERQKIVKEIRAKIEKNKGTSYNKWVINYYTMVEILDQLEGVSNARTNK